MPSGVDSQQAEAVHATLGFVVLCIRIYIYPPSLENCNELASKTGYIFSGEVSLSEM